MGKTIKIAVEVEIEDDVDINHVVDWITAQLDNIPYEELDAVEEDLSEKVTLGLTYFDGIVEEN